MNNTSYWKTALTTHIEKMNEPHSVPTNRDECLYCVLDVSSGRIGDTDYFNALADDCLSKEVMAMFLYPHAAHRSNH